MAKYCNDDCHAVCDFCKFYNDYGVDHFDGTGMCEKKSIEVDASGHCEDDFECFRIKDI